MPESRIETVNLGRPRRCGPWSTPTAPAAYVVPIDLRRRCKSSLAPRVPQLGPGAAADFRAVGRIPLVQGWKAAFSAAETEPGREKEEEAEADQALPRLVDGQSPTLTDSRVQAKQTPPPPRYGEGTLVDAMQNAWRF
jgi:hypothetical protein